MNPGPSDYKSDALPLSYEGYANQIAKRRTHVDSGGDKTKNECQERKKQRQRPSQYLLDKFGTTFGLETCLLPHKYN